MALTDNCDLYVAVHEDGFNRVIGHIMRQRPSLFNYGTADVSRNRELWCEPIEFTSDVMKYGNPIFSVEAPIPLLGADSPPVGIGFCAQVAKVKIDFYPSKVIKLPAELNPPLKAQRFAISLRGCGAIECPALNQIEKVPAGQPQHGDFASQKNGPPIVLTGKLNCVCLDVYVIGHFERTNISGQESLLAKVDDIDIVDIEPEALEANFACYLRTTLAVVLREKLTVPLSTFALQFPLFTLATVSLTPTPNPPVPHNPAIDDDQIKLFMTMTVT